MTPPDDLIRLRHLREAADKAITFTEGRDSTDLDELRRPADTGNRDAIDQLVELAGERGDLDELRRLTSRGSQDAAEVLAELEEE